MTDQLPELVVRSEVEALSLLEQALAGSVPPWGEIKLDGWPTLTIYLKGAKFDQTITSTVMRSLLEYQRGIYQAYAAARYDNPTKRLTDAERQALEIRVKVEGGSSELSVDVQALALEFIKQIGGKMDSNQLLIVIMSFLLLYFSHTAWKTYLDHRKEVRLKELTDETQRKSLETMQFMSAQETERSAVLASAITHSSSVKNIANLAHDAQTDLLKAASTADEARIGDVPLTGKVAVTLVHNARRKSEEVRLDGTYLLRRLDWSAPSGFRVKILNTATGLELDADVQDDSLTGQYRQILQRAEWSRQPVKLQVNARQVGGVIQRATILHVDVSDQAGVGA